jgi:hypothetical protein
MIEDFRVLFGRRLGKGEPMSVLSLLALVLLVPSCFAQQSAPQSDPRIDAKEYDTIYYITASGSDASGCWMQMETEREHYREHLFVRGGCPALIPNQSVRGHYHPNRRNIQIVFIHGGKLMKQWWLINSTQNLPPPTPQ